MTFESFLAFAAFCFVTSVTPGPNNLMLMASGANFGVRRTVPHWLGIGAGFTLMIIMVGFGLIQVFDAFPVVYLILKALSVGFLLYLAWKIATASALGAADVKGKPITFVQAALFQWVNPKAWAMALTAISVYAPTQSYGAALGIALIFGVLNLPTCSLWMFIGHHMRRVLTSAKRLRVFNVAMATLLVMSLYLVIFPTT